MQEEIGNEVIKIGIFVEGQSERIFVVNFLSEYLGEHAFSRVETINLGCRGSTVVSKRIYPCAQFYFLIFDTTGDGNVVPALLDRAKNMIENENYRYILALQDLYRRPRDMKTKVIHNFDRLISAFPFHEKLRLVLAIMEIEAWYLADYKLFGDATKVNQIKEELGYDLINTNPESYDHPAEVINKIYKLRGMKYRKKENQTYNLVKNIDFAYLCSDEIIEKMGSWRYFLGCVDESISS